MKVLMIMASNSGTAYWRLYNWWEAGYRTGKADFHVLGWEKDNNNAADWQFQIGDPNHQPRLFGMLYSAGRQADVIVFQRLQNDLALTTFYAMKDQFPNTPILSEVDDDITDVAYYNQASEQLKPGSDFMRVGLAQFKDSDAIIVSTPYLKEVYSEFNEHIYVVPNSIDINKWSKLKRKNKRGLKIGWAGSTSHVEDLALLREVIPPILEKYPQVRFKFLSNHIPEFLKGIEGVKVIEKWVPILKYPQLLADQDFDIGLAPLVDNKFNRAKSNLRWLEYSALSIPCVASNVGHFKETVRNGTDGFLANDKNDFINYLSHLIEDRTLRREIGATAYLRIFKDFNTEKNIDIYLEAIKDILTRPAKAAPTFLTGTDELKGIVEMSPLQSEATA